MSEYKPYVVIDTNILFSALLVPASRFATIMLDETDYIFTVGETVIIELFEHKERIIQISRLSSEDVLTAYHTFLRNLVIYKENLINKTNWQKAIDLCKDVDEDDTAHVALTLELDGLLWTGDKRLRRGLEAKGFARFFVPEQI